MMTLIRRLPVCLAQSATNYYIVLRHEGYPDKYVLARESVLPDKNVYQGFEVAQALASSYWLEDRYELELLDRDNSIFASFSINGQSISSNFKMESKLPSWEE